MYSIPNIEMLLACVAMGFVGSLLWAAWSRGWDWWVGDGELAYKVAEIDRATACLLNHHQGQLHSVARRIAMGDVERNALAERLDKIEDIVYNARKFDTVQEFQNHRVPYASKAAGYPVDPPTCW